MSKLLTSRARILIVSVCSLFIMLLLSACQGVVSSGGSGYGTTAANNSTITGQVQAVNAQAHSVTLLVNGQQVTISGLTAQQIAALQSQVNKNYAIQVTQSGNNSYTIDQNTEPQEADNTTTSATTAANENGSPAQGTIEFAGKVQNASNNNVVVATPDGQSLSINIVNGQTDLSDLNGAQLNAGQVVKVKASTDQNGNFTATKLGIEKLEDQQKDMASAQYKGITTSAVGSSNRISFKVGNKNYSFPIANGADLKDFNSNAHSINANVPVEVKVTFNGTSGTVVSIDNPNGN